MEYQSLIGNNPNGHDLPIGFGMQLAGDTKAMETFGRMSQDQKDAVVSYIQGSVTGEEAENRVEDAVEKLKNGQMQF